MLVQLDQALSTVLGDASKLGGSSWLEILTWIGTLFAAISAGIALRRQSFQSRATVLLALYERWEAAAGSRQQFARFLWEVRRTSVQAAALAQGVEVEATIRQMAHDRLLGLQHSGGEMFFGVIDYVSFFELLGVYVRNGYIPLRDAMQLYKGPALDLDTYVVDFIRTWQNSSGLPPGLFENAIYLVRRIRRYEDHPYRFSVPPDASPDLT